MNHAQRRNKIRQRRTARWLKARDKRREEADARLKRSK